MEVDDTGVGRSSSDRLFTFETSLSVSELSLSRLSLLGEPPERAHDGVAASFLSLGAMTGSEAELGTTH